MKLYCNSIFPFVRKVSILITELELDTRIQRVDIEVSPSEINKAYADVSPLIQVPALQTEAGFVLSDSHVICAYLANIADFKYELFLDDDGLANALQCTPSAPYGQIGLMG